MCRRHLESTVRRSHGKQCRGSAMIVAIVCLLLVTAISFSLVRYAVAAHRQSIRLGWRLQSEWLAESSLSAAAARLGSDPDLSNEEWMIENIGSSNEAGRVQITVSANSENQRQRTLTVTADFPDDSTDRARTTRTLTMTLPETEPAPTD